MSEEIRQKAREELRGLVRKLCDMSTLRLEKVLTWPVYIAAEERLTAFAESLSGGAAVPQDFPMVQRANGQMMPDMTKRAHKCEWQGEVRAAAPSGGAQPRAELPDSLIDGMILFLMSKWPRSKTEEEKESVRAVVRCTIKDWEEAQAGAASPAASPQPGYTANSGNIAGASDRINLRAASGSETATPSATRFELYEQAIASAVEREREECAKLVECGASPWSIDGARLISAAAAIRSRASQPSALVSENLKICAECGHGVALHEWEDENHSSCLAAANGSFGTKHAQPCMCSGYKEKTNEPQFGGREVPSATDTSERLSTDVPATVASGSSGESGLLASPHCPKCGTRIKFTYARILDVGESDRFGITVECYGNCDFVMECWQPEDFAQFFRPSPSSRRELAARIAALMFANKDELREIYTPAAHEKAISKLTSVIEEELSR